MHDYVANEHVYDAEGEREILPALHERGGNCDGWSQGVGVDESAAGVCAGGDGVRACVDNCEDVREWGLNLQFW